MFEDLLGGSVFDQPTGAIPYPEDCNTIGDPPRLGEIVGYGDHGVAILQADDEVFYDGTGDRVECTAGLVEKDDFRGQCEGAGDTQPLLLTAG